jgi:ribosome silencing factor RsfS/YbeB/iojap
MSTKKKKKAAAKKTSTKKAAKKASTKKAAKKATKKTAKKATKKTAKKAAKKTAKKATKKTAKKAAKKTAKKAAKKTAKKASTKTAPKAEPAHEVVALPSKKKLSFGGYGTAPDSEAAAVTLVPDGDDDGEDALEKNLSAAFDAGFALPKKKATVALSSAYAEAATEPPHHHVPLDQAATIKIDRTRLAAFVAGDPSEDLAQACAALTLDKKAEDVVILKVSDLTSYADYFVIAAAPSERQVQAIARNVTDEVKRRGKLPLSTDGLDQGNWVIVDYGSVVVHVFLQSARGYYDLDGFWVDAPRVAVDEGRGLDVLAAMAAE